MGMKGFDNFVKFIREHGVIGLAVGFILGGAIAKVVTSLVTDIVNPILGIVLGMAASLKEACFTIGSAKVMWGSFINTLIDFIVISAVVYFLVKVLGVDKKEKER